MFVSRAGSTSLFTEVPCQTLLISLQRVRERGGESRERGGRERRGETGPLRVLFCLPRIQFLLALISSSEFLHHVNKEIRASTSTNPLATRAISLAQGKWASLSVKPWEREEIETVRRERREKG
jgi:hypothetical protein